ncbi:MAG TPA: RNA methyltransferase [Candidatus Dormibacteraeota bacterium]|nr:RNA methyltransferase [Candidatus Dormibacteraeota bacterium]
MTMPPRLGERAPRLAAARSLLSPKGRAGARHFLFEGPTLLREALRSGIAIDEIYVTPAAYDATPLLQEAERSGVRLWSVSERAAGRLSDVESPTGIVVLARRAPGTLRAILDAAGTVLLLADLADPGNAGSLLRAAEAFGATGVVFGRRGVDPYHPKVVRAAAGALFRVPFAVAGPDDVAKAIGSLPVLGLTAEGALPVWELPVAPRVLVVGQERRGLGAWAELCTGSVRIPMEGRAESLNAAVAGSIALYEASRRPLR